ncbi:MAG: MBL fold hydrolase [Bacteroidetes bacterium GWF2_38_335]|nr:MAG: MBL fold hydrolase [Bacteroidetes bacterium GWF2_38_335]OFY82029.1 MAG: MBL fold hydrolase [Bacteroidetes bacterium RIFOXYA12_FULL_38_20]HBS86476.1 MBL fold hydrolase [Bacteroidales bacterium]
MVTVKKFIFNDFQENTYVLYDETGECVIIDCGCYYDDEQSKLKNFIADNKLKPVKILTTHGHIDHIPGNRFVKETYKIPIAMHQADQFLVDSVKAYGATFGFDVDEQPKADELINDGDTIRFGNSELIAFHVPGHSPGSIVFYNKQKQFIIAGDVLFYGSIGRTDLPGGSYETLISGIKSKLLVLPDEVLVYCGHGPETTIGAEKRGNPFLK